MALYNQKNTTNPVTPVSTTLNGGGINNGISRGGASTNAPTPPSTPPLPQLIQQQPLPVTNTDQYNQYMAQLQAALQQQQAYGTQVVGLQNQLNALSSQDRVSPYLQQQLSLYRQDPLAAIHQQQMEMARYNQPLSQAVMLYGY